MREKALALLQAYNQSESLVRHGLQVEAIMRHYAQMAGEANAPEGVEYWGCVGLLHDVDYEQYPQEHCKKAVEILENAGYDGAFIHAVTSHGYGLVCDVEPQHYMEKVLYTIDELSGLIHAAAIMRPSRSVMDLEVKSVKKKFKDKKFAAGVDRQLILDGCQRLGMELDEVINQCILGMRAVHTAIGL
ncbi:hydrolase [Acutalibacter caecimuris]|uniref:hydrolase n=1 Tax=Acutalibacter caecimuris TaxID=3093657 RepID=UPI003F58300F